MESSPNNGYNMVGCVESLPVTINVPSCVKNATLVQQDVSSHDSGVIVPSLKATLTTNCC